MIFTSDHDKEKYSIKRKEHTEEVRKLAVALAKRYGADKEKAEKAAVFHDMFRGKGKDILDIYVREMGLPERYIQNPDLSHSKIAAIVMEKELGIRDEDILNAVKYHTTGRADMSKLERVIFLADSIEPGRDYPGVEKIRELSNEDLDAACLVVIENTIGYLHRQNINIDPDTEKAREWLKKTISKKGDLDEQQKNSIACG